MNMVLASVSPWVLYGGPLLVAIEAVILVVWLVRQ